MKEWHIKDSKNQTSLLIEKVSILKGDLEEWIHLMQDFEDYFSYKSTSIEIFQNETSIPRKEFVFQTLSPDEKVQSSNLDKALALQKKQFLHQLEFSPFYKQLVESWEELVEEVDFLNNHLQTKSIRYRLSDFDETVIQNSLSLSKKDFAQLTNYKRLLLSVSLLEETVNDKRVIIFIKLPERVLSSEELNQFIHYLKNLNNGIFYFILTEHSSLFPTNVFYKGKIRNKISCLAIKNQLIAKIPSTWSEETFQVACNWYMKLVDKYSDDTVLLSLEAVDNLAVFIYLYSIFILTNTPVIVDLSMVSLIIKDYFENLTLDKV